MIVFFITRLGGNGNGSTVPSEPKSPNPSEYPLFGLLFRCQVGYDFILFSNKAYASLYYTIICAFREQLLFELVVRMSVMNQRRAISRTNARLAGRILVKTDITTGIDGNSAIFL